MEEDVEIALDIVVNEIANVTINMMFVKIKKKISYIKQNLKF